MYNLETDFKKYDELSSGAINGFEERISALKKDDDAQAQCKEQMIETADPFRVFTR